ncbi:MAG: polysaccharide biosynthesis protein [Planctomycetes bacterium]|nr:polysaccharide biosynthesis protein [Planctomycetota bacterium]
MSAAQSDTTTRPATLRDSTPTSRARRVVLVGTAQTIPGLRAIIAHATEAVGGIEAAGVVLLGDVGPVLESDLPVVSTLEHLAELCARVGASEVVVSLPASASPLTERLRLLMRRVGIDATFVPTTDELLNASRAVPARSPRPTRPPHTFSGTQIDLAALIGRAPHQPDSPAIASIVTGKRVLITGAGGSIGSELSRLCARFDPAEIALVERAENALFEIDRQLSSKHAALPRRALLHDVVDEQSTRELLASIRPDVVLHAAAHKHVPLMEDHPAHAVTNNVFGTKSIADASVAAGVGRFVMISSDKAVNPTSVMGATKRLAELYVQGLSARAGDTRLSMVRFGNVLGSSASVLQIWSAQLAEGGPITVTDPRMTRYFMTIPEAAALVMQSASIDDPARAAAAVYVLDMGQPVRILDLAERFVRRHGLTPRIVAEPGGSGPDEIEILVIGRRPGEKIHEELAYSAEQLQPTRFAGINSWVGPGVPDTTALIADLHAVRASTDPAQVVHAIRRHVPQLQPRAA